MAHFNSCWQTLDHFGTFWTTLDHYGPLLTTGGKSFYWCNFFTMLSCIGLFYGPFASIYTSQYTQFILGFQLVEEIPLRSANSTQNMQLYPDLWTFMSLFWFSWNADTQFDLIYSVWIGLLIANSLTMCLIRALHLSIWISWSKTSEEWRSIHRYTNSGLLWCTCLL